MNQNNELWSRGYNPLRWNCENDGCFNKLMRPKIQTFFHCFPGRINFGDVDGLVEINGRGLLFEWKSDPIPFYRDDGTRTGQGIMYQRLTRDGVLTVICAAGDAETMETTHIASFFKGKYRDWAESSLEELKLFIEKWRDWALNKEVIS